MKIRVGITVGDPSGVGPEITKKALKELKNLAEFLVIDSSFGHKVKLGQLSKESGKFALENLNQAIELLKNKEIDTLVTAPVSKEAISLAGEKFIGQTEYLAKGFKVKDYVMSFASRNFFIALASRHLPLNEVSAYLTSQKILLTIKITSAALKKYFGKGKPRIAVCGLNPHAGEGGILGREEIDKIIPALKQAKLAGINVVGPVPADALFFDVYQKKFDAVIAMYHDQGLVPLKMIDKFNAVNMTLGLPFIRTSPAHGTAFNIAGKNKADPLSMIEAVKLAVKCTQNSKKA